MPHTTVTLVTVTIPAPSLCEALDGSIPIPPDQPFDSGATQEQVKMTSR